MPLLKINESDLAQPIEFRGIQDRVQSLLFYPDDPQARAQYVASRVLEFARRLADEIGPGTTLTITAPPNIWLSDPAKLAAEALAPAVRRPEKAEAFDVSPQGLAGLVLLQAFSSHERGDPDVSLTKCIEAVVQILRTRQATLGSTKSNIKDVWHKYRPVAHIAAAFIVGFKRNNGSHWFNDPLQFVEFLRVANTMKTRGEAIRHKQAVDSILVPGEGWEFVISPSTVLHRTGSKISEPGSIF